MTNTQLADQETRVNGSVTTLAKAVAAHLKGEPKAALHALGNVSADDKDFAEIVAARAHLRMDLKQYEAALADYEHLIALRTSNPDAHFQAGVCLYSLGRAEEAEKEYGGETSFAATAPSAGHS